MLQQWRRRIPLAGGRLLALAALACLAIAVAGFASLYQVRAESLAANAHVRAQVQMLEDQQDRLQRALTQAQNGDNADLRAREYFKLARPGEKRLVVEPAAPPTPVAPPISSPEGSPPYWRQWRDRLLGR